jgi:hypothetical protein
LTTGGIDQLDDLHLAEEFNVITHDFVCRLLGQAQPSCRASAD